MHIWNSFKVSNVQGAQDQLQKIQTIMWSILFVLRWYTAEFLVKVDIVGIKILLRELSNIVESGIKI